MVTMKMIDFIKNINKTFIKVNHSEDNDEEEEEFQQHGVKVISTLQSTGLFSKL